MPGRKRAAPEDATTTRPTKTTKTSTGKAKGRSGPKANLSLKEFKSQALPLHVSVTRTSPAVVEDSGEKVESTDPAFLAALSLRPDSFATGTYGWKGSKRVTIEIDNPDTGEKEKLQVQLSFNATVLGSKGKGGEDEEETKEEEEKKEENDEEEKEEEKKEEKEDNEEVQEE